jgi:hypothetical protein
MAIYIFMLKGNLLGVNSGHAPLGSVSPSGCRTGMTWLSLVNPHRDDYIGLIISVHYFISGLSAILILKNTLSIFLNKIPEG